ncbi:E3 ubiquitin-protein ligase TRIM16 [Denticeps clupeoides]|uniref:Tripartite motif-containing protein 16-like n=1 Tax=Denticeps clupeoides TaxID=299321 RepID=A0AAY4AMF4_9TELE|nr:E3 ubiquitin-protein ligase TRIM16-like [Denticeps clupeoides]
MEITAEGSPDPVEAAQVALVCDVCTGKKRRADQSCMECVASFCETHLELHNVLHTGKRHRLVQANTKLEMCLEHEKFLEVYCRTDKMCICYLCITDEHRGHDVVSIESEVKALQSNVVEMQASCQKRSQEREEDIQKLKQAVESLGNSAQAAIDTNRSIFSNLIKVIAEKGSEVENLIRCQETALVSYAESLQRKLEVEVNGLRSRELDLEALACTEDHMSYLERFKSVEPAPPCGQNISLCVHPYNSFDLTSKVVSEFKTTLENYCLLYFGKLSNAVETVSLVSFAPPCTREAFIQCAINLTLDENTLHDHLGLSEEGRKVRFLSDSESYPYHSDRFERRTQVLCKDALHEAPCYWEVGYGGGSWVSIAVSYKGIYRKGKKSPLFGRSADSWALRCNKYGNAQFWQNNEEMNVLLPHVGKRIGVYLDQRAGILAFYNNFLDSMDLIVKIETTFKEPLYAGFGFGGKGSHLELYNF